MRLNVYSLEKILILLLVMNINDAQAISKLSITTLPEELGKMGQNFATMTSKIQEQVNFINEIKATATGEINKLKNASSTIRGYGNGSSSTSGSSSQTDGKMQSFLRKYAASYQILEDAKNSVAEAKKAKYDAMSKDVEKLEKEAASVDQSTSEGKQKYNTLQLRIQGIKNQMENIEVDTTDLQKAEEEYMASLQEFKEKYKEKYAAVVESKLNESVAGLFSDNKEESYSETVRKLFLEENEASSSENITRVRKARDKELFEAFHNLMNVTITDRARMLDYKDQLNEYKSLVGEKTKNFNSTKKADTYTGARSMTLGAYVVSTKLVATYTEILLANIRYNATYEMSNWIDKYRMPHYDKDIIVFNLSDYTFNESDVSKYLKERDKNILYGKK